MDEKPIVEVKYTEPILGTPDTSVNLQDIYGNFIQVTTVPSYVPKKFIDGFAIDTTNKILYYYDFTNNVWLGTGSSRVVSATSYTTDTGTSLSVATADMFVITAQAGALKFNNPSGSPTQGRKLIIRIKDNGTARALTYDTQFRAIGTTLPTTTVLSKTLYMGFIYNSTDTKWDCVAVSQEV